MPRPRDPGYPYGEFDAQKWAEEFQRVLQRGPLSVDAMQGWFANAIMTGYDAARNPRGVCGPDESHDYHIQCRFCGQYGNVMVSVEPRHGS